MKSYIALILALATPASSLETAETIETIMHRGERLSHNPKVYRLSKDDVRHHGKMCTTLVVEHKDRDKERGHTKGNQNGDRWLAASCVQYDLTDLLWRMKINTYSVLDYQGRTSCGNHSLDGIPDIVVEGSLSLSEGYALNRGDFRTLQDALYGRTMHCATKDDQDFFEEAVRRVQR